MVGEEDSGAAAEVSNRRVAWQGCSVLLDINDGDRLVFARLSPAATVKIGNKALALSPLVGCPFGTLFQVEAGPKGSYLVRADHVPDSTADESNPKGSDEREIDMTKDECFRDNRQLVDNNTAQSLSCEDIEAMRREGATGNAIIEALIANSSTFENKTVFSQEKYRIRKQKKYAPKILLRRPFTRSICEAYFKKHPDRIGFLRMDSLSLLLSMANIGAHSEVLVVDKVGGLVTGAVAERLGNTGNICSLYFGTKSHSLDIVRIFNLGSDVCRRIVQASFSSLSSKNVETDNPKLDINIPSLEIERDLDKSAMPCIISPSDCLLQPCHGQEASKNKSSDNSPQQPGQVAEQSLTSNGAKENALSSESAACKPIIPGREASFETIKLFKEKGFSSLIIAAPELDPDSIIQDLLPLLSYSATFAIYHQYLQPLSMCMHKLHSSKEAVALQLSEPWLREYQVLPSRTHPHMQMSGSGGYVLSGIRACSNNLDR